MASPTPPPPEGHPRPTEYLPSPVPADDRRVLVETHDDTAARRLESHERRHRLGDPVVVRQHGDPRDEPQGTVPGDGDREATAEPRLPGTEDHRARRATSQDRPPRIGREGGPPDGAAEETSEQVGGPTAREVDEVRLPDGLGVSRVVGVDGVPDQDGLDLGSEGPEVSDTGIGPPPEDGRTVRIGRRRQDGNPRPTGTRRLQEPTIDLGHGGKEFAGPDEGHRACHRSRSLARADEARRATGGRPGRRVGSLSSGPPSVEAEPKRTGRRATRILPPSEEEGRHGRRRHRVHLDGSDIRSPGRPRSPPTGTSARLTGERPSTDDATESDDTARAENDNPAATESDDAAGVGPGREEDADPEGTKRADPVATEEDPRLEGAKRAHPADANHAAPAGLGDPSAMSAQPRDLSLSRGAILLAVTLGSGIVFLDTTIVNVALESIGRDLPTAYVARLEGLTYVTGGYLVVLAALLILGGALSDYYGRRRVFQIGFLSFGATSVLCGLAPSLEVLIVARLAQGAAGALLVPGALSIITATFQGEERARSIAVWAAATSALTVAAPILGGVVVQTLSWRAAFLVNVPIVAVGLAASRAIPESRNEKAPGRFDWFGAVLVGLAVGGLSFGTIRGREEGWGDPSALGALIVGLAATLATPVAMAKRPDPLIPIELVRRRDFSVVNLATFIVYGALYVTLAFQGLFFQGTLGYTPTAAGLIAVPIDVCLVLLSTAVGRLAGRFGPRPFTVAGPLLMAAGLAWLARIPATSPAWRVEPTQPDTRLPPLATLTDVGPGILLFGLGLAVLVAPLTIALMASVPVANAGLASAMNNAVSRAGAPLVSALLFVAISATFYPSLAARVPGLDVNSTEVRTLVQPLTRPRPETPPDLVRAATEASTDAYRLAMLVSAGLLVLGGVVSGFGLERRRRAPGTGGASEGRTETAGTLGSAGPA